MDQANHTLTNPEQGKTVQKVASKLFVFREMCAKGAVLQALNNEPAAFQLHKQRGCTQVLIASPPIAALRGRE
jgi:hypothetical protein